ncbi:MAG: NnrS family protein, partial [Pseudomonadota bacterium]|nr:NnrS family protein [Pseudomonadota bacterium]
WHQHEMLFGYTAAVIAGFLLTAVRNWTGMQTLERGPLAGLGLLWLAARLLPYVPGAPGWLVALVDALFLPALALGLARPLLQAGQKKNRMVLVILLLMALANAMLHLVLLGVQFGTLGGDTRRWIELDLHLVVMLMAMIGGRVLPFFTANAVPGARRLERPLVEKWAPLLLIAWVAAGLLPPAYSWPRAILALAAAVLLAVRMSGWYHPGIWKVPILWVLHVGYGWIVLGLVLDALAALGLVAPTYASHAFTVGAIGVLTLGMISRVALGHTGRPLRATGSIALAYVLLVVAALVRICLPLFLPSWTETGLIASAVLWCLAFGLFVLYYIPILTRPRADGRPG